MLQSGLLHGSFRRIQSLMLQRAKVHQTNQKPAPKAEPPVACLSTTSETRFQLSDRQKPKGICDICVKSQAMNEKQKMAAALFSGLGSAGATSTTSAAPPSAPKAQAVARLGPFSDELDCVAQS